MQNSVIKIFELLLGALLIGLGLLYMMSHHNVLACLADAISLKTIEDINIYQQYSDANIKQITDEEVCGVIMGYREYPIMVDDNLVPLNGNDYTLYFTYLRDGYYKKEYQYDANRHIVMLLYTYMDM